MALGETFVKAKATGVSFQRGGRKKCEGLATGVSHGIWFCGLEGCSAGLHHHERGFFLRLDSGWT